MWQRKKEISSQFKSAVESGHIPPPQAGSDTKRRSKLDQLQQAGLSERYDSRGSSSSNRGKSKPGRQMRDVVDEDDLYQAHRGPYMGAYDYDVYDYSDADLSYQEFLRRYQ